MAKSNRKNIVYSTNPNYQYQSDEKEENETLAPEKQYLKIWLETKHRGGKTASVIKDFVGSESDLKELAGILKNTCGTGGSVKEGEIIIQGDHRDKILQKLTALKYKAKKAGG